MRSRKRGKKYTTSRRLSRGAAQDAALNERVDGLRRMFLSSDCHNVMPVSCCCEEFLRRRSISENCRQQTQGCCNDGSQMAAEASFFHSAAPLLAPNWGGKGCGFRTIFIGCDRSALISCTDILITLTSGVRPFKTTQKKQRQANFILRGPSKRNEDVNRNFHLGFPRAERHHYPSA